MPSFSSITLTNVLRCQGTQAVYGVLNADELVSASEVRAVEDVESLTFQFTRLDRKLLARAITAQLRAGRVITAKFDDGSFDEWRVGSVSQGRGSGGVISVQCVPLWFDLVERANSSGGKGWVSDVTAGVRNFDYEITERSASSIFSAYILPNCPSYITLGTIDPTYVIPSLSVSRLTPGALAMAVRDALRNVDVPCELQLRRNGTTDYKLDLVTEIGASAVTPVFHPNTSLLTLTQKSDPTLQATRILMRGGTAPDGLPGMWGRARFRGAAPVGLTIALTDRNGGASPIAFDGQFVGGYLLRVKTGRTFLITASAAAAGSVTLASVSTIAVDEDFEFRLTEPGTNTRTTTTRYAVSAVPDGTHITLGASAPITVNNQYVDWYAKVWSAAVAGTVIATTRIASSVAATDVIAVASSAGVSNTHFVEFVQLDGAGEVPSFVDHPLYSQADPVGYGIKVAEMSRAALGVTQLVPNGWMRVWSNPANPPDGYTKLGTFASARNSAATFTVSGGYSWGFSASSPGDGMQSPPIYVTDDHGSVSVRCTFYMANFLGSVTNSLYVVPLNADGTQSGAWIYTSSVDSPDMVAGANTIVNTGTWLELKIKNIPITPTSAPYGFIMVFFIGGGGGGNVGYVDTMEAYSFGDCPTEPFEFGDAPALLQSGNNQLRLVASPPLYYTIGIRDLERIMPTEFSRLAQTIGGDVRAVDTEYGIDTTVRLLARRSSLIDADKTELTLANRPTLLSNLQRNAAATQRRVIDAVNAGTGGAAASGPAFVALTANATLTSNAEIATPSGGTVIVTLPAADAAAIEPTGSSVTYVPPDPATTPTTVVTAGLPPSRRKPIPIY